jgi:hypothetical protein
MSPAARGHRTLDVRLTPPMHGHHVPATPRS